MCLLEPKRNYSPFFFGVPEGLSAMLKVLFLSLDKSINGIILGEFLFFNLILNPKKKCSSQTSVLSVRNLVLKAKQTKD